MQFKNKVVLVVPVVVKYNPVVVEIDVSADIFSVRVGRRLALLHGFSEVRPFLYAVTSYVA